MQFSSIWSIDRALSGANTPGQSWPGRDDDEGVFHIPQSSSITGTSPSDCLVSYPGHLLGEGLTLMQRCSWCILPPQPTGHRNNMRKNDIESKNESLSLILSYRLILRDWYFE